MAIGLEARIVAKHAASVCGMYDWGQIPEDIRAKLESLGERLVAEDRWPDEAELRRLADEATK